MSLATMSDIDSQLLLQTWMSAAFPTGAFSCSHGIESAIADGRISNASECEDWIAGIVQNGSGWNDALIIANAYAIVMFDARLTESPCKSNSDDNTTTHDSASLSLSDLNALALALCSGAERLRETTQLGQAFAKAAFAYRQVHPSCLTLVAGDIALPVAIGVEGALAKVSINNLLPASLQASSSNLVWIATRLVPLGQTQALRIISKLQPMVQSTAQRAMHASLEDIGSATLLADLASIEHEQLASRICIT